jgi:PAS domain S-box-containing protein
MKNTGLEQAEIKADSPATDRGNLQTFFDTIGDFLWVLDASGNILSCNHTVYERLGYREEELAGISVLMVHPPERRAEAMHIVQQMLKGEAEHCPIPLYTKDGNYIPVETYIKEGEWDGRPALFGWSKDISRLKLSEEKFSKTFHLTKIISGISDLESGVYTDVNEEFCSALGYAREEVIGRSSSELNIISKEQREYVFNTHDIRNGIHNVETDIRCKDGKRLRVMLSAELIHIQDRKYLYTTAVDITPLAEANRQVYEAKQKLEEAQRIGNIGDWSFDLYTRELVFSDQVYRIFGTAPGSKNPLEIFKAGLHPDDNKNLPADMEALVRQEGTIFPRIEFRILREDGEMSFCQAWGEFAVDAKGNKTSVYGTLQDITDHKRTQIELKELNAVKDKFLSIIAHDLRNPFNTIFGYTELLIDAVRRTDYSNLERYGNIIQSASERALSFLVNMLEWSRSGSGKIPFKPDPVDVKKLVLEVISLLRYHADMKQIRIRMDLPENLVIQADRNMFRTIAINLISNAIKFSDRESEILISAEGGEHEFCFSVTDHGVGMSAEEISGLFIASGKKSKTGTGNEKGTGLGLVLCQDFAERHRGKIQVESEPGIGSRFSFLIPLPV